MCYLWLLGYRAGIWACRDMDIRHLRNPRRQAIRKRERRNLDIESNQGVFIALAVGGWATMWMTVFAEMRANLMAAFNGLRLLNRPRREAE